MNFWKVFFGCSLLWLAPFFCIGWVGDGLFVSGLLVAAVSYLFPLGGGLFWSFVAADLYGRGQQ